VREFGKVRYLFGKIVTGPSWWLVFAPFEAPLEKTRSGDLSPFGPWIRGKATVRGPLAASAARKAWRSNKKCHTFTVTREDEEGVQQEGHYKLESRGAGCAPPPPKAVPPPAPSRWWGAPNLLPWVLSYFSYLKMGQPN